MKKSKVKSIIKLLNNFEKENRKVLYFRSIKDLEENSKVIFFKKGNKLNFFLIFFICFFTKFKIKKNFFLLFNFKNNVLGHNFLPQWPGIYNNQNFFFNFFKWIKLFFYIILHKKKLLAVVLTIN